MPCLFGFISTWLAKRKGRRRLKKRKATEARSPTPEPLGKKHIIYRHVNLLRMACLPRVNMQGLSLGF